MRKKICFLLLGSMILSAKGKAAEKPEISYSSPSRVLSHSVPSRLDEIRAQNSLLPANTHSIPLIMQTGITSDLDFIDMDTVDLKTVNFLQFLEDNPLTPSQINNLISAEKWQEFRDEVKKEGQHISFTNKHNLSAEEEQQLKAYVQWKYAEFFMGTLQNALPLLSPVFYEKCPAALIVGQQFSANDTAYDLATKYENLGLQVKDAGDKLSAPIRHLLMGEAFALAGQYFLQVARQATDVFAKPDLFLSSAICLGWAAMHCDSGKAGLVIENARQALRQGYHTFSPAFAEHRRQVMAISTGLPSEYTLSQLEPIKKQLQQYTNRLVKWAQDYDPDFYETLTKRLNGSPSVSSGA